MSETEFIIEPGRQDIVMSRVFDAPRETVFRAVTDPELIPRWWGPHRLATRVDIMEVRPGGRWCFVNIERDGREHGFRGVYHDVVEPERIVQTWEYEGTPQDVALETVTLHEEDGRTRYVARSVHSTVEARDAIVRAGGPEGGAQSMDRLAAVLADMLAGRRN